MSPKFDPPQKPDRPQPPAVRNSIPGITEPRCHVCISDFRAAIDKLLAQGVTPYAELERMFQIDRRSISNHAKNHLGWEEAAIRRIVEQEAEKAHQNAEEGISGIARRRTFLEAYLEKALVALTDGEFELSGKDALAVIQHLDKLDATGEGVAVEQLRIQFNAFVQAIREICTPEQWQSILDRTRGILGESSGGLLPSGDEADASQ
jgi:hypothetical protein